MNQAHLHLLITHLPIFGSILGGLVLTHGLWTKSNHTLIAAYNLLVISAVGSVIAYLTGEGAEEIVEKIPGMVKDVLDQHEDSAVFSLVALIASGLLSAAGIFLTLKQSPLTRTIAFATLFVSLIGFGLIARTGYLGGKIRHTEINSSPASPAQDNEEQDDD